MAEKKVYKIVLVRHGESVWNKENRFTGWTDVDLSEKGVEEAKQGALALKKEGKIINITVGSLEQATNKINRIF